MECVRADPRDPNDLGPDDQVHFVVYPSPFEESRAFMVNALGAREYYAGRAMNDVNPHGGEERLSSLGAPRNHRWTARATKGPDYWAATLRLPFASLGLKRGRRQALRFNVSRAADLLGDQESQTLLPPPSERGAERRGWLVFER